MKSITLPKIPSKLIRIARRDLIKVMKQPKKYRVMMGQWHDQAYDENVCVLKGVCGVCQAGAVMAQTLKMPRTRKGIFGGRRINEVTPTCAPGDNYMQLTSLDELRTGAVDLFCTQLGVAGDKRGFKGNAPKLAVPYISFGDDSAGYLAWLEAVEKYFRAQGL
jgi:hypothetical protein